MSPAPARLRRTLVVLDPRSVWRAGGLVIVLILLYSFGSFVLHDGGSLVFQVIMAWLASIAMEPAVSRLAHHMRRGLATALVMLGVILFAVGFSAAFGNLLVSQAVTLVQAIPEVLASLTTWLNTSFGTSFDPNQLLEELHITPQTLASIGVDVAGGVLGVVVAVLGGIFSLFTLGLFIFYFSADAPRLKRWIARLLPPQHQEIFLVVWGLAVKKTGGYVAARVVLAAVCGGITAIFLLIIGMPYWLALGVWTGVVSQFVPTVGTYIAIALPVVVGLTSADPVDGVLALIFALIYQQIENLTIEPKISADAVEMHPAVAFGAVILGAALFGVAGAFVAVPIAALLLSLVEIYSRTYDVLPQLGDSGADADSPSGGASPEHGHLGERLRRLRLRSREAAPADHES
ncbi:MAG TPA: AI-2E family transporter [Lapillicoccus sp.]|uniref:AI-2E family transporter n=1 Tax=Lapillicoccus sp. TaxID=1909287 RepID=UPI002F93586D